MDLVAHGRAGGQQVEAVLTLEPFAHDLHVEQAEEAAAEAESESVRGLGAPGQGGVVEAHLVERVAQVAVAVGLDREQATEDHRLDVAVSLERLRCRVAQFGERVADLQLGDILDAGDHVSDLAEVDLVHRGHDRTEETDVIEFGLGAVLHGEDVAVLLELAVHHAHVGDHAAVLVEFGIEDQRPGRSVGVAGGRRHAFDDRLEHLEHAFAGLRGDLEDLVGVDADQVGDLLRDPFRLGARQVDLVHDRDQLEAVLDRQVGVRHGLRLDALGGIDDQQGAFAGGQAARDLV